MVILNSQTVRKKCPYSELFWSVFSRIWTEYREILCISLYSVQMREEKDQNNSGYGQFLRNETSCWELIKSVVSQGGVL